MALHYNVYIYTNTSHLNQDNSESSGDKKLEIMKRLLKSKVFNIESGPCYWPKEDLLVLI